ncbi:DUF2530 domain-containing protein [Bifidobacterium xylocopae]|uniref:DUF2530 domain-containing protein n=1 Tax=Bifidobacterium xylocopae TaxID=2493119 RepID=A0A366KGH7_9BIFI|nr:DUF2530 domain-containing protein [Bifidobacterium xylocopae]RBP99791.1 DUF2530 domain-containing protein [Bifidobacterium xylocopae]
MKLAPIFDPDARRPSPKPVQVDLRRIFTVGTAAWALAMVVCFILLLCGLDSMKPLIVSAAGVAVGLLLLVWEHFNRWDYRRLAQ